MCYESKHETSPAPIPKSINLPLCVGRVMPAMKEGGFSVLIVRSAVSRLLVAYSSSIVPGPAQRKMSGVAGETDEGRTKTPPQSQGG